ncbi:helix-turn-helix transcriptional regulator [Collimonas sp.]|uniref:helix-turn-helix transcriptional regulator n=1 Tax=Collimonas sp. TaxID=1963772 RepID=UPI002CB0888D|nr:LuxR C-terminal-related transcriptional regulator [Collimonas sp.]HWW99607.1 LuxR C-terminal-related transcriptional regulator [Collimonas sp.]
MKHLTETDLRAWLAVIADPLATPATLLAWLEGPLKKFFPYQAVILGYGELTVGQVKTTHVLASGHDQVFLDYLPTAYETADRSSIKWWRTSRQPFFIDPENPPAYASAFEIDEIQRFGLGNVVAHGVLNIKANAGCYFSFSGVEGPLSDWHLEALKLMTPLLNDLLLAHFYLKSERSPLELDALTAQQRSIVRHLAAGMDDKTIGRTLNIAEKTVRNQLGKIYAQLGVHKRSKLIALLK